jgi:hypothetical protein
MMPKGFREEFNAQSNKVSDKWDLYLSIYERAFAPYQEQEISLLEIGIQNGGSLEVYARYFRNHKLIVGCDIDPRCARLSYPAHKNINVVVGDANTVETKERIEGLGSNFDIIIDDGSHTSDDIVISFLNYFSKLRPGGLYVIEDLHASYWQSHGGGLFHPSSSMQFLKDLSDLLNLEHWGVPNTAQEFLAARHPRYALAIMDRDLRGLHSIQFFNSVCLISKDPAGQEPSLGARRIRGTVAAVVSEIQDQDGRSNAAPNQRDNPWSNIPSGRR